MPSQLPVPGIDDFLKAFHGSVRGGRDATADGHDGSAYDYLAGIGAILWSQQALRDRDLFRAKYIDDADGDDLTTRVQGILGVARSLDTFGIGRVVVTRPNAGLGGGTFWNGTRIRVQGGSGASAYYEVAADTTVGASATGAMIPIRATAIGSGSGISTTTAAIDDPLWDNTWAVSSLTCSPGTDFEDATTYRARARTQRVLSRAGYKHAIVVAAQSAGAATVAAFPSNYGGDDIDHGVSAVYVGDAGFNGTTALVNATKVALESTRVCGCDTHVGAMMATPLAVDATVYLWGDPSQFDQTSLTLSLIGALQRQFSGTQDGFTFTRDGLGGALLRSIGTASQGIVFNTPSFDASVLTGPNASFPVTLPRYQLASAQFTFAPPQ